MYLQNSKPISTFLPDDGQYVWPKRAVENKNEHN